MRGAGDRLSLAINLHHNDDDESRLQSAIEVSRRKRIPLLATNHVHYHDSNRRALQDVLTCIRHGCTIQEAGFKLFANAERHLKSPQQMHRLFVRHPGAIERGLEIAERCRFNLSELKYDYPTEVVPPGPIIIRFSARAHLQGAADRLSAGHSSQSSGDARKRIEVHLSLEIRIVFPDGL